MDSVTASKVNVNGETVFNIDDILNINANVRTILAMTVPSSIPHVEDVDDQSIPSLLKQCQNDVGDWDPLVVKMTKIASDLNQFANDQLQADSFLATVNSDIQSLAGKSASDRQTLLQTITSTFDYIKAQTDGYEKRAADMASDLRTFRDKMGADSALTVKTKAKYQTHIDAENTKIENWQKAHGLKPTKNLVDDLNKCIDTLNDRISSDNDKLAGYGTMTGVGSVIFILTCWTGVGALVGGALTGVGSWQIDEARKDREDAKTNLDQAIANLEAAKNLNALEIWFDSNRNFFDTLSTALNAIATCVESLRGQWQAISNQLDNLSRTGGTLDLMKSTSDDFSKLIAPFALWGRKNDFKRIADATLVLQKVAFTTPRVMDYKKDFAREAVKKAA